MSTRDDAPVTIRDVARAAGVAVSTASRALNGVSTSTRGKSSAAQIRQVADSLGYVPHHAARALRGLRTSVVVLADDPSSATSGPIIEAMEHHARGRGDVVVSGAAIGPDPGAQLATVRLVCSLRPLAVVVSSTRLSDPSVAGLAAEIFQDYRDNGGRLVVVGRPILDVPTLSFANVDAGATIGRHAVSLGRTRYGILAGVSGQAVFDDRTNGFLAALDADGVPRRDVALEHGEHSRDGGYDAMSRLLRWSPRPQIVMAVNDTIALGALAAVHDEGLRVPEDIALSGIDDQPLARDVTPPLTTLSFPFEEAGLRAAALALDEATGEAPREELRGELVVRESTVGRATG
ncbi:LacI family DNA-binding transcriptional regulator [Promicromonospora sukumoe]|uniref:LacI family DNA-binding transcriptional regulator n=1 Tax=Promicromonospora sukumoe TaxID=88382 RepID=UPI0037CBECCA